MSCPTEMFLSGLTSELEQRGVLGGKGQAETSSSPEHNFLSLVFFVPLHLPFTSVAGALSGLLELSWERLG